MIEGQGLFNLAARSEAYAALSRNKTLLHSGSASVFSRSDRKGFDLSSLGAISMSANTTIRAMLQDAWNKVTSDENHITDENLKRLEKASKSDNKEIAAERLRQAKAKLRALRLQAQVAAASGDAKQLRRIAQQAAQAAREVASAARGLAEGIVASASSSASDVGTGTPLATTGNSTSGEGDAATAPPADGAADGTLPGKPTTQGPEAAYLALPPVGGDSLAWGREALRQLGDDARSAIAQARGLIAFVSQAARSRRHQRPDPDEDAAYRDLQRSVTEAGQDLDGTLNAAYAALQSDVGGSAEAAGPVETTTVVVQVMTEITVTADIIV